MRVKHLSLVDFRNYELAELSLEPGFNLIVGRNGQGKTNLIEAIAYFASLSSHRVSGNAALIRAGTDFAVMRMRVAVRDREVLLESQLNRSGPNRAQVNQNAVRARELPRWFSAVVFAPEDLSIVRGEPSLRRNFLNEAVIARNPAFIGVITDYERVLKQRTSLLKSARASGSRAAVDATLPVWNNQLIELGVSIMIARRELVDELSAPLRASYSALVEADHSPQLELAESVAEQLSRAVVSRETLSAEFQQALDQVRPQEIERGVTLIGPHRDDLVLGLNGLPIKGYASHGESWSYALSMRLALAKILADDSPSGDPVVILDDVFAELDARRRSQLLDAVRGFEQVIVTAAVEEDIPKSAEGRRIRIDAGKVILNERSS